MKINGKKWKHWISGYFENWLLLLLLMMMMMVMMMMMMMMRRRRMKQDTGWQMMVHSRLCCLSFSAFDCIDFFFYLCVFLQLCLHGFLFYLCIFLQFCLHRFQQPFLPRYLLFCLPKILWFFYKDFD